MDWQIDFLEAFDDGLGGFDIVIANPPYIRQELIGKDKIELQRLYPNGVDGKSDLYCYFYIRGLELLRPGGIHVFVCSNSWLDSGFGGKLQAYLLENAHILAVYDSAIERQFATADVNTIVSVLRKGRPADHARTKFIYLKAAFSRAVADPSLRREVSRTRLELRTGGLARETVNGARVYKGDKWGGRYFRAPDALHQLLSKSTGLLSVGESEYWEFGRGRRTGCDEFFYLTAEDQDQWKIEDRFIRPLIKSPTQFMSAGPETSRVPANQFIFLCHDPIDQLKGTTAARYIHHGENLKFDRRLLHGTNETWYSLGPQGQGDIVLPIAFHDRFFVAINDAHMEVHQRFAVLTFGKAFQVHLIQVAALLHSFLVPLMAEVFGRRGLGQGVLDFPPDDWRYVQIPNPATISKHLRAELADIWMSIATQAPKGLQSRNQDPIFQHLDQVVAKLVGIDPSNLCEIYEDISRLVNQRLTKAKSV